MYILLRSGARPRVLEEIGNAIVGRTHPHSVPSSLSLSSLLSLASSSSLSGHNGAIHVTPVFVVKRARRENAASASIAVSRGYMRMHSRVTMHSHITPFGSLLRLLPTAPSYPLASLFCPFAVLAPARIRTVGGFYTAAYRMHTHTNADTRCIYRGTLTTASQLHISGWTRPGRGSSSGWFRPLVPTCILQRRARDRATVLGRTRYIGCRDLSRRSNTR